MESNKQLENPIKLIKVVYPSMSKSQKKIADLILSRKDMGSFLSLTSLSNEANVTAVTVVKFCKMMGYSSFSDFKKELQKYFQNIISPKNIIKSNLEQLKLLEGYEATEKIIADELKLLNDTLAMLSRESVMQAVSLIVNAKNIYIAAKGMLIPIAELLQLRLNFLSINSTLIKMENMSLVAKKIIDCNEQDLFIIFSFPNYTESLGDLAKCAKLLNSKVVCITDKAISPPSCYSDVLILSQTSSMIFYNSMTIPTSIINIILSLLAIELSTNFDAKKEKLQSIGELLNAKV